MRVFLCVGDESVALARGGVYVRLGARSRREPGMVESDRRAAIGVHLCSHKRELARLRDNAVHISARFVQHVSKCRVGLCAWNPKG